MRAVPVARLVSFPATWGSDMSIDPIEFGKVLARLQAQDQQIAEMREDIKHLVNMANQGKGGLLMLTTIGTIVGSVIGWIGSHLMRG